MVATASIVPITAVSPAPSAVGILEGHLKLVGAWVNRAITLAWDSGRLGGAGELPFEHEVAALLDGAHGRVPERVVAARALCRAQEAEHDRLAVGPLVELARELGLSREARDLVLIIAAPAIWGEMARLYGIIAADRDRPICDELLVAQLLDTRVSRCEISQLLDARGPLVRSGLVQLGTGKRPFCALALHPIAVRRLYGDRFDGQEKEIGIAARDHELAVDELVLAPGVLDEVRRLPALDASSRLVVRGRRGSGRRTVLATLAASIGRRLGVIDVPGLLAGGGALKDALVGVALRGWLPCVSGLEQLTDARALEQVRELARVHEGPIVFRCPLDSLPPIDPGWAQLDLAPISEAQRIAIWRTTRAAACAEDLAARFAVGPGVIRHVATTVVTAGDASGDASAAPTMAALDGALRQFRNGRMGQVATQMTRLATWDSLVLPDDTLASVRELVARVRHRRTVFDRWGFDGVMTTTRGVTALFEGGPGTGKTMVAGVIARELGYDLFRVDLGRVLSKWVGETERNLGQVFDAAEEGQTVLVFDEADSLFSKRTEVESTNDRYANMQVNYLLQRLDSFDGIAILTTNLGTSIDPAFRRRLAMQLRFPFPDNDMRKRLWRAHLPDDLPIDGTIDCGRLARKYQLSGGYVRTVALRAAFLAAHDNVPVTQHHLELAARLEYQDQGKLSIGGILE